MGLERNGERERYWRGVLRRRSASGMSIVEFCEHEGLKASTFHYWQREIRRRDEELQSDGVSVESTLAPVRIIGESDGSSSTPLEIVATNGYRVRVGQQATSEQLRCVLHIVSEL